MDEKTLQTLRYPIGKFVRPKQISAEQVESWIDELESLPLKLSQLVRPLETPQLETAYRPEGWTIRQLVHHLADSHHHSYIRFKWALTEDKPLIKPYDEKEWSKLHDALKAPIALSLDHLSAVHAKLVYLLRGLEPQMLKREFIHPEGMESTPLSENIGRYAWHGNHHYMHIYNLCKRQDWL